VLKSLEKFATNGNTDSANKAAGLQDRFEKGKTLLMLKIAVHVFTPLENLNRVLQAESATLGGMLQAVDSTVAELQRIRSVEAFEKLFMDCNKTIRQLDLEEVVPPRQRKPPARYHGRSAAYHAATAEDHYRAIFFLILDNAMEQLQQRFDKSSPGICKYLGLEEVLLLGHADNKVIGCYPELDKHSLDVQLRMFQNQFTYRSVQQARAHLQSMCPEVRSLFGQVEQLVRLLLICPASSCTAERSFSALRRLKTWLRSNMTQERLNCVAVANVHQDLIDSVNLSTLAEEFAGRSEIRRNLFGSFSCDG
jgi:hypothetical protein